MQPWLSRRHHKITWHCRPINKSWAVSRHQSRRRSSTIAPWPLHSRYDRRISPMGRPPDRCLACQKFPSPALTQIKTSRLRASSSKTSPRASSSKKRRSRRNKPEIDWLRSKPVAGSRLSSVNRSDRKREKLNESRVSQPCQQKSLSWSTSPMRSPPFSISWLRRDTRCIWAKSCSTKRPSCK